MIKKILIFLIPIVLVFAYGFKPKDQPTSKSNNNNNIPYKILSNPNQVTVVDSKKLNANQISTWFRTNGSFNRDPSTGNAGFEWPKGQAKFARYASGIWIGAVVGNDTLVCIAEYDYEYDPGFIDDSGNPQGKDDPNYRLYNITSTDTTDYPAWRTTASQQGAYLDSLGNPLLLGSQTQFYSYSDGYPASHGNNAGSTRPLKAQILQTNWSYSVNGPLSSMSFSEFRIINRSSTPWTQCYIALWTDDDLGGSGDDAVSVDTALNLGITYNFTNSDAQYGAAPPAVGFDYFRGPLIPSPGDVDSTYSPPGSNNLIIKNNVKQLGVTAFNMYTNGDPSVGDPSNFREAYGNLKGIRRNGTPWINPISNEVTTYAFLGDPAAGTGWNESSQGDRRFMQCSGPLVVNPGDTQTIVVGQVIARGGSNLQSVNALKQADALAQRIFDNNFQVPASAPCPITKAYAPGNGKIYLSWNDSNEKITIPNKLSNGIYKFQGYNIYAVRAGTNGSVETDRLLIATYDLRDSVGDILDSVYIDRYATYVYTTVQKGSNNGISRYIVIDKDFITNEFLVSGTPYYFSVTSYFYDKLGGPFSAPKVNESPINSCLIQVIPQSLTSGTQVHYGIGDTLYTNQRDLGVMPIVIEPLNLVTASYTSIIGGTTAEPTWTLVRTVGGSTSTLVENNKDFTGNQDTAKIVNGLLLVHQTIRDSGVIKDPENKLLDPTGKNFYTRQKAWTYAPPANNWLAGPDTIAIATAKVITGRQFQSRSLGMSFPTIGTFRNNRTKIVANGSKFDSTSTSPIYSGGPLRKIEIVFGQTSKAYRFVPTDTNFTSLPYVDMVDIPFSVYHHDDLDETANNPRQLNVGFVDADNNGAWNPDTSPLGGYHFTYIFASSYNPNPNTNYTSKNPGFASPVTGFPALDVMYAWLPRVATGPNGAPLTYTNGDRLTVSPYRITKPEFIPGYPIKYSWNVDGSQIGNPSVSANELGLIKAFPNPYFGGSRLETDPFDRFIYFSHLPAKCNIYIYTLDGVLVRKLTRDNLDPNNSLEKWDLLNSNSIPVASGMYVVYIDAGAVGATTLKIAIFSPTERIQTF